MITMTIFEMLLLLLLTIGTGMLFVLKSIHHQQLEAQRQFKQQHYIAYEKFSH